MQNDKTKTVLPFFESLLKSRLKSRLLPHNTDQVQTLEYFRTIRFFVKFQFLKISGFDQKSTFLI